MKNGVNWGNGFAIGDTDAKNCPLKMPYFPDQWELHFCYLQDRRSYQMEAYVFNNFFLRWDFTFQVTRAIKSTISARDWHILVARFFKKPGIIRENKNIDQFPTPKHQQIWLPFLKLLAKFNVIITLRWLYRDKAKLLANDGALFSIIINVSILKPNNCMICTWSLV